MIIIDESKLRKQPWDFGHTEVRQGEIEEPTGYKCVVCDSPINRLYITEIDKKTGDIISAIVKRDTRYTCSDDCKQKWEQSAKTGFDLDDGCFTGYSKLDENGRRKYVTIGEDYLGGCLPWGQALEFKKDKRLDDLKKLTMEEKINDLEFKNQLEKVSEDYFNIDIEDI